MRVQVCIIGGGPSGLLLSQLLHRAGIGTVVLEKHSRAHVLSRIRAGVLETGACELLRKAGVGARLDAEGFVHDGISFTTEGRQFRIDFRALIGRAVTVYGQTEITRDLYDARDEMDGVVIDEAQGVTIHGADSAKPAITYSRHGTGHRVECEFIAGCDGFHGVSRQSIPAARRREFERIYPFGWLGVLSETPPVNNEVTYTNHPRGFALCSMRNAELSRYYIQVPLRDRVEDWSDDAFWDELRRRLPPETAQRLVTGPSVEKSIAPLRSFISEPMRWGRLFLAGDAAHIVPPTGAKGLNLAASDIHYLSQALIGHFQGDGEEGLAGYSDRALARIWQASRFSWWMTNTLHVFPEQGAFGQRMQEAELAHLEGSRLAQAVLAENYTGLPY